MLQFRPEDRERVASGDITVSYRLWKRRHVRPQREYATSFGTVYVESVEELPAGLIDPPDLLLTGFSSIEAVWWLAGEHTGVAVTPDTILTRVQFRFLA